jgi:hypothetical protein
MGMNPRLLRPTASGFDPRSIAGLALWLDAANTTSSVELVNGRVASWKNIVDPTFALSQASANVRPGYGGFNGSNAFANGLPCIDSVSAFTSGFALTKTDVANSTIGGSDGASAFYVVEWLGLGAWLSHVFGGPTNAFDRFNNDGFYGVFRQNRLDNVSATTMQNAKRPTLLSHVSDPIANTHTIRREAGAASHTATSDYNNWYALTGRTYAINAGVHHCEYLYYNRVLSNSERNSVESYLMKKWIS